MKDCRYLERRRFCRSRSTFVRNHLGHFITPHLFAYSRPIGFGQIRGSSAAIKGGLWIHLRQSAHCHYRRARNGIAKSRQLRSYYRSRHRSGPHSHYVTRRVCISRYYPGSRGCSIARCIVSSRRRAIDSLSTSVWFACIAHGPTYRFATCRFRLDCRSIDRYYGYRQEELGRKQEDCPFVANR